MYSINANRLDRKFAFDGMAKELGFLPIVGTVVYAEISNGELTISGSDVVAVNTVIASLGELTVGGDSATGQSANQSIIGNLLLGSAGDYQFPVYVTSTGDILINVNTTIRQQGRIERLTGAIGLSRSLTGSVAITKQIKGTITNA